MAKCPPPRYALETSCVGGVRGVFRDSVMILQCDENRWKGSA